MGRNQKKIGVLIDTNFILHILRSSINISVELDRVLPRSYELLALPEVEEELQEMCERGGKTGREARRAAEFLALAAQEVEISEPGSPDTTADDAILEYASKNSCVVATNDQKLRERLRNAQIPVLTARGPGHLFIDGHVSARIVKGKAEKAKQGTAE